MRDAKFTLAHHSTLEKVNVNKGKLVMDAVMMSRVLVLSRFIAFITDNGAKNLKSQREYWVRGQISKEFFCIDTAGGGEKKSVYTHSSHRAYV